MTNKTKNSDIPTSKIKWSASFNFTDIQWKHFYSSPFTTMNDTNIQWFQSQILHRILQLHVYLRRNRNLNLNLESFTRYVKYHFDAQKLIAIKMKSSTTLKNNGKFLIFLQTYNRPTKTVFVHIHYSFIFNYSSIRMSNCTWPCKLGQLPNLD